MIRRKKREGKRTVLMVSEKRIETIAYLELPSLFGSTETMQNFTRPMRLRSVVRAEKACSMAARSKTLTPSSAIMPLSSRSATSFESIIPREMMCFDSDCHGGILCTKCQHVSGRARHCGRLQSSDIRNWVKIFFPLFGFTRSKTLVK